MGDDHIKEPFIVGNTTTGPRRSLSVGVVPVPGFLVTQLVLSIGTFYLIVTSQGCQTAL